MLDGSRYHVNMIDLNKRDQETPPIERLYQAYRACTSKPDAILASLGLGRAHHRVLYFLGRHPGITVKALLEAARLEAGGARAAARAGQARAGRGRAVGAGPPRPAADADRCRQRA